MHSAKIKRDKNCFSVSVLLFVYMLASISSLQAQIKSNDEIRVTIDVKDEPLYKVLTYIEQQTSFKFAYNSDLILEQKNITYRASNMKIADLLNVLFEGTSI